MAVTGTLIFGLLGLQERNDPANFPHWRDDGLIHHLIVEVGEEQSYS